MKRRVILVFLSTTMLATAVGATDYQVELSVELVKPANRDYLNIESCQAPGEEELQLSWSLDSSPLWVGAQDGDIFLAADDTCSSALVEIGKSASEGLDVSISEGQTSGQYPETGDTLLLSDVVGLDCNGSEERDYYLCIRWEYEEQVGIYSNKYIYRGGALLRFDVKRPEAPLLSSISPGESNLRVSWETPADDDIDDYIIHYRPEGTQEDNQVVVTDAALTSAQVTGLENGVTYEVWMTAVDLASNESDPSNLLTGMPEPVKDFWESYRDAGGSEDGGFCFVATAAWGSYASPWVKELRGLRDRVLLPSTAGRHLVSAYYRYGPRWARAIRGSEPHRAVARLALAPLAGLAVASRLGPLEWLLLGLAGVLLLALLGLGLGRLRRLLGQRTSTLVLLLTVGLAGLSAPAARAAESDTARVEELSGVPPRFQFELRFGFYRPRVDSEAGLNGQPFKEIFGGDSELLFELGLDYQVWRGFGVVYAGASLGFVQYLGKALTSTGEKTADTTVFNLLPLRLGAGYAFDKFWDWWGVPLLPYVEGGLDYYIWWVLDGVGDVASWDDGQGNSRSARGGIFGGHLSVGMKLLLDALDREAAGNLEAQTGVKNSFLFVEYSWSWIDGFGSGDHMNLGDDTIMFGLAMEF